MPDGLVVFTTLLMFFALADFSVIACASMLIASEAVMAMVIIVTNMSVTFFMVGITSLTRIGKDMRGDGIDWSFAGEHDSRRRARGDGGGIRADVLGDRA